MSGLFIFLVIFLVVICMVSAISKFNQHPLIILTVIAIAVGLACRIPTEEAINAIKSGLGNILASIDIIALAGTIIGTIFKRTGVALIMANTTLRMVGEKNSVLTMAITGYVIGIPVLCDSGFVISSPILRALASQGNVPLVITATALPDGLYATHYLVLPTLGPIVMTDTLEADLGLVILVGLPVSIPATPSAPICAKKVSNKIDIPANPEHTVGELLQKYGKPPGALHSFSPILLPIVLVVLKSMSDFPSTPSGDGVVKMFFSFIGNPVIALTLGTFLAMTLVPVAEKKNTLSWITEGATNSTGILVITGAGGASGVILQKLPIADTLSASLLSFDVGIFLPSIIAVLLKTVMGTSIVAMTTTPVMVALLMPVLGFTSPLVKVLVIMATGTGSITVSYANDSYFWVVSQLSGTETRDAHKCQTGMTGVMDIATIIIVFLLSLVFVH